MAGETRIRPAERRDLAILGQLGTQLIRDHHSYDPERFFEAPRAGEEGYARFLATQLEDPEAVVQVAERAGEILGYVYGRLEPTSWMELRGPAGFLHDVVVVEHARRQGLGARLVESAAEWLEAQGAPRIMLWTAEKNAGAHRLFERLGFRRTMVEMTRERFRDAGP
jgi:GNAT superfamily N-acetyltransferase